MLITFSGLDGAGKTTLIARTLEHLRVCGFPVVHLTMYDDVGVYAMLRRLRDVSVGHASPERLRVVSAVSTPSAPSLALTLIRARSLKRILYFFDILEFSLLRLVIEGVFRRVLVLDRYFYDSLADISADMSPAEIRLYVWVVPVPNLPIFVEASPEAAFARKREYSVPELAARRRRYDDIFREVPGFFILVNDDLVEATRRLTSVLDVRIGFRDG